MQRYAEIQSPQVVELEKRESCQNRSSKEGSGRKLDKPKNESLTGRTSQEIETIRSNLKDLKEERENVKENLKTVLEQSEGSGNKT